jgi:uracil-DNA glycosylase family 4
MPDELESLRQATEACLECSLGETRTNLVFGHGDTGSEIVFIGEAPGLNEDKQGIPFVGAAGKLLTELLSSVGISRDEVYIANILKCRPPGNRDPLPEEIAACRPVLFKQLAIIKPKVVVTLGAFATRTILNRTDGISKIHGQVFDVEGYAVFPMYHPAAALYARSTRELLDEDFRKLKAFLASRGPTGSAEEKEAARQDSLF